MIELVRGDITLSDTDAIVNPSNTSLILGAGVSGSIARAGGPSIQEEMSAIGRCPVGGAVITGAGNLPSRFVIHAVGPRMGEGNEDNKLKDATEAALALAEERNLASITFPAISTGIFGFPMERCATIMLTAVLDHLHKPSPPRSIGKVVFCLYTNDASTAFGSAYGWLTQHLE